MESREVLLAIVGLSLTTFLPRYLPFPLLASRTLPRAATIWLRFVPAAVICAMLFHWLFAADTVQTPLNVQRMFIFLSLPVAGCAYLTRHFFGTVLFGCTLAALGRIYVLHA